MILEKTPPGRFPGPRSTLPAKVWAFSGNGHGFEKIRPEFMSAPGLSL